MFCPYCGQHGCRRECRAYLDARQGAVIWHRERLRQESQLAKLIIPRRTRAYHIRGEHEPVGIECGGCGDVVDLSWAWFREAPVGRYVGVGDSKRLKWDVLCPGRIGLTIPAPTDEEPRRTKPLVAWSELCEGCWRDWLDLVQWKGPGAYLTLDRETGYREGTLFDLTL